MNSVIYLILAFMALFLISKTIEFYYKHRNLSIEKERLRIEKIKAKAEVLKIIRKEEFMKLKGNNENEENIFELYCSRLLPLMGFENIEVTPLVADGGKDIIATKNDEKYYIECKLWDWNIENHYVDRPVVQKLVGAMVKDRVKKGMIITTTNFSNGAIEYANGLPEDIQVQLYDGDKLVFLLEELREQWVPKLADEIMTPAMQ